jgi:hypothetical protein
MLHEFMVPLATICCCAVAGIAGLDRLCLFHQTYQAMVAKLETERWLLQQCSDPHFFSKMYQHSDLCFQASRPSQFVSDAPDCVCRSRTTPASGPSCWPCAS